MTRTTAAATLEGATDWGFKSKQDAKLPPALRLRDQPHRWAGVAEGPRGQRSAHERWCVGQRSAQGRRRVPGRLPHPLVDRALRGRRGVLSRLIPAGVSAGHCGPPGPAAAGRAAEVPSGPARTVADLLPASAHRAAEVPSGPARPIADLLPASAHRGFAWIVADLLPAPAHRGLARTVADLLPAPRSGSGPSTRDAADPVRRRLSSPDG